MSNIFMFTEAIASVSLSHPQGHDCDVCKAAKGDDEARLRVMVGMERQEFNRTADHFTDVRGHKWNVHNSKGCVGDHYCPLHNPSEHKMNLWPLDLNAERDLLFERLCEHGVHHPDPDSVQYLSRIDEEDLVYYNEHECDGCCGS